MPFLGTRGAGSNRAFGYAGAAKPNQVTGLTATDFGTSRAFNNGRIDLSWTAPANNGATISGYKIERSTDNSTYSTLVASTGTTATTYSDTSLTSSQIYYYKVSAINAAGTGDASTVSSATVTTVPQAPTIGTATAGNASATVTYTAGATGGKAVSAYTATSSPGSLTGTGASPITVSGLSNGTAYTFTVTATNANGTSTASAASNSVTPFLPTSFDSIATFTPSSGQSVTFSSIPSTYKYLQLRVSLIGNANNNSTFLRFNGDTGGTSYAWANLSVGSSGGTGSSTSGYSLNTDLIALSGLAYKSCDATYPTVYIIDIPDYASTSKYKTAKYTTGINTNGGNQEMNFATGTWKSNSAINSITFLFNGSTTFSAGTTIALYGVN